MVPPDPDGIAGELVDRARHVQAACLAAGRTVALAESCTGGLIAAALTSVDGSSGYFLGGVVSYANAAKTVFLDVPEATLEAHGAVSAETAAAMAAGARWRFGADLALAVTGIAGPSGGSAEKPVGLVFIGLADARGVATRSAVFPGGRAAVRRAASAAALDWLVERART